MISTTQMRLAAVAGSLMLLGAGCTKRGTSTAPPGDTSQATAPATRLEDLRGTVVSIEVTGLDASQQAQARARLTSTVGAAYDRDTVAADVRALWALGGLADVTADGKPTAGGIALRYHVRASDRIRNVDVRGGAALPAGLADTWVAGAKGQALDGPTSTELRKAMLDELHALGYLNATVDVRTSPASDGLVDVLTTISEGPQVVLSGLELRGNSKVARATLLAILGKPGELVVGEPYRPEALEPGRLRITEHYQDLGHVQCDVGPAEETLSADRTTISVVLPIHEGDVFRIGAVKVEGALLAPKSAYLQLLGVRKGQVFGRSKVVEDRKKLEEFQRQKGQQAPEVLPSIDVNAARRTLDLTWQIQPTP